MTTVPEYGWSTPQAKGSARLLLPAILKIAQRQGFPPGPGLRVLDLGCGNGYIAGSLLAQGCEVTGVDASAQGIEIARETYPNGTWLQVVVDDSCPPLPGTPYDVVISTEVVEHLYAPKAWARAAHRSLRPGGLFICSTPYHGYLKNLTLSVFDKWDRHANPMWDGGHIKLWSPRTLSKLLTRTGFEDIGWLGVGRAPWLWKGMLMWGRRPAEGP